MSGQSITDRINAAKYSIAGQGLAKTVHKATTEEIIAPKKKHVDYLIQCTSEPNVSIPHMANLLIERTQHQNWVVVFKSLVSVHHLMNYGNERFSQYLASNNCSFQLENFFDKTTVQAHDMSKFVRRYSKYIHQKAYSYRLMAFDFCKIKRGKEDGVLRTMNGDKLLKTLPVLQGQLDGLLEFDASPTDLGNNVIHSSFILLFKDLIRLFACYNDGVINLLEKYFEMNKKQCKEALDLYKKFLVRMERVSGFLKVAETMGVDKGDIPDLAKAPSSLLDALEAHLLSLDGKKGGASTPTGNRPAGFSTAVDSFSKATTGIQGSSTITEEERRRALEEENKSMQELWVCSATSSQHQAVSPTGSPPLTVAGQSTNPFALSAPSPAVSGALGVSGNNIDFFGGSAALSMGGDAASRPSDDLMGMSAAAHTSNPFVHSAARAQSPAVGHVQMTNNVFSSSHTATTTTNNQSPFGMQSEQTTTDHNIFNSRVTSSTNPWAQPQQQPVSSVFVSGPQEINFEKAFGVQQPPSGSTFDAFGGVMAPTVSCGVRPQSKDSKLIEQDVDISLANIVGNLDINGPAMQLKKKEHQWKPSPTRGLMTGGANWTPANAP